MKPPFSLEPLPPIQPPALMSLSSSGWGFLRPHCSAAGMLLYRVMHHPLLIIGVEE